MTTTDLPVMFCFSGQGSQYHQMGAELRREHPVFRDWLAIGDEAVRARHGFSPLDETYAEGKGLSDPFDRLEATSPALFLVQYALAKTMIHAGIRPEASLGISLGETVSMALGGMCSFEDALAMVADHPAVYARTCAPGGMTAFLGDPTQVEALPEMVGNAVIAGINGPAHGVVAGLEDGLSLVEEALTRMGAPHQRLAVPYAFHSTWVDAAAEDFRQHLPAGLSPGRWDCWSSLLARPAAPDDADLWWRVVRGPMNFAETVAAIEARGGALYLDLSPSGTIATILRQGLKAASPSRVVPVLSPFGEDMAGLNKALDALKNRGAAKAGSRMRLLADA